MAGEQDEAFIEELARITRSMEALTQRKPLDGRVVVVFENEVVTDPISGAMYCTQKVWDNLKKGINPS